jgi:thymidylate kinase
MLIAFEGQDGAGKTALLTAVYEELRRQHVPTMAVAEFSDGPSGQRLVKAVARDKFLRPVPGDSATVLTRTFDVVADLYYLDEAVISPALDADLVVLKDRHLDTVLYTLPPTLVRAGAVASEERAHTWLRAVLSELRHRPAVTVYVDAPLDVRLQRITHRTRHLSEARSAEVSAADLDVFAARERIIRQLIAAEPARFITVENGHRPLHEAASDVLALVHARHVDPT